MQSQCLSPFRPKLKTAYEEFGLGLTFDIKKIDDSISLKTGESVCIIGERKYTNILLARLCVRALLPKRHSEGFSSLNVIVIDAGNSLGFYQYVNFARQYGLDIKKVLQHTIVTRVFTIYQLANIIINELPKVIEQYNEAKLILIYDLLDMFLRDSQLEINEGQHIIKQIINSLRRRKEIFGNILIIVSLSSSSSSPYHHNCHRNHELSTKCNQILLPRFDKSIEIANNGDNKTNNLIHMNIRNKNNNNNNYTTKNCHSNSKLFSVEKRDLLTTVSSSSSSPYL
jgi:hypothetical protein